MDLTFLVLRLGVVGGLYAFLLIVLLVIARDLARPGRGEAQSRLDGGRLLVVASEADPSWNGRSFSLDPKTTIGRDPSSILVLSDSFASAKHAVLSWRDGRWWLEDLGSTNGTWLNHEAVKSAIPVGFGDLIRIGRVTFKLTRD